MRRSAGPARQGTRVHELFPVRTRGVFVTEASPPQQMPLLPWQWPAWQQLQQLLTRRSPQALLLLGREADGAEQFLRAVLASLLCP